MIYKIYTLLFARPFFYKFNNLLFTLSLRGLGILNYSSNDFSGEKFVVESVLSKHLTHSKLVFVDIGANVGEYALHLRKEFPQAEIYAFEPSRNNYQKLKKAVLRQNIKIFNKGISSESRQANLYDYAGAEGSQHASLSEIVITDLHNSKARAEKIKLVTLDSLFNGKEIDFLKIDTEGHELEVLKGATELIRKNKIKIIQFEFNEMNVYNRVFMRDFEVELTNYVFFRLLPKGVIALPPTICMKEIFAYQNILAIHESLL